MLFHMIPNHATSFIWLLTLGALAGFSTLLCAIHLRRDRSLDLSKEELESGEWQRIWFHYKIRIVRSAFAGVSGAICGSLFAATAGFIWFVMTDLVMQAFSNRLAATAIAVAFALLQTVIAVAMLRYAESADYAELSKIGSTVCVSLGVLAALAATAYGAFWLFTRVPLEVLAIGALTLVLTTMAVIAIWSSIRDAQEREERRRTFPARRLAELQYESWCERKRIERIVEEENIRIDVRQSRARRGF